MLYTKYQSSRLCGFGEEDFQRFFFRLPWQLEFFMEWNHLNNLYRAPSKEHLCKVWSLSHQWFWRWRCLSKLLTDDARRTTHDGRHTTDDDGRQTQHDPKSSPWHYVPGELKLNATAPQPQRNVLKYFAIFKNVSHSLEPGETPSYSASHQAPNYVQRY